jgi:acyl-CoA synthetase (AMP-forming)/AMP-acid ligase II
MLRERASLQPDDIAFTFVDYDQDWDGVAHTLTWAQLNRRVTGLADELRLRGLPGGDEVSLALGNRLRRGISRIDARGVIAVPLSVPMAHPRPTRHCGDARRDAVVHSHHDGDGRSGTPIRGVAGRGSRVDVLAVDSLDLDTRRRSPANDTRPKAYLQYTRIDAHTRGVMVSNRTGNQ